MAGRLRRRAERLGLMTMAGLGIAVIGADALGWLDKIAADGTIPKITLQAEAAVLNLKSGFYDQFTGSSSR